MANISIPAYTLRDGAPPKVTRMAVWNRRGEVDGLLAAVRRACRYPANQEMKVTSKVSIFKDLTY